MLKHEWPQLWMDPGPHGKLGDGTGYAMAAKLTRPDARVVPFTATAASVFTRSNSKRWSSAKIPVVAIIGNDAGWTQIRRGQVEMYGEPRAVATALEYTRYEKVVEACGGFGAYVEKVEELGPALDAAFAAGVPACAERENRKSDFRKGAISV